MSAVNLSVFVRQAAQRWPDRLAVAWRETRWSWRELDARIDGLVNWLRDHGIRPRDAVALQCTNSPSMIVALWAVFRTGAVLTPLNFRSAVEEVALAVSQVGARAMILDPAFAPHAAAAQSKCDSDLLLLYTEALPGAPVEHMGLIDPADKLASIADVERDTPAWYFLTSGSTGRPKAAILTHGQMGFVVNNHLADLMPDLNEHDRALVIAPLSHGAGIHHLVTTARGCASVLLPDQRLDAAEAIGMLAEFKISNAFLVPTIVRTLMEALSAIEPPPDLSSLRYLIYAGAPMYREDQRAALRAFGPVLVQYYGLAEVTGAITVLPRHLHDLDDARMPVGSCGYARTGMQMSVRSQQGIALEPLQTGEVWVRGSAVFVGYLANPAANAAAFEQGWFRTGDVGHLDANGFLYLTGRLSDMFISGGSNIYPREIEEAILTYPGIREVCVVGLPDEQWGEVGVAVVACEGAPPDLTQLAAFLAPRLARYKLPRRLIVWDTLPKSAYGKITKAAVKALLLAEATPP